MLTSATRKQLFKIALTIALLAFLSRSVDFAGVKANLGRIDVLPASSLLLVHWATQMITAQRWRIFAGSFGMPGPYRSFVRVHFAAMFFNLGIPSLVGGDVVKAYTVATKSGAPFRNGLASVLQDRAAGLAALLFYGSAAVIASPLVVAGIPVAFGYVLAWFVWVGIVVLVWKGDRFYRRFLRPHSRSLVQRLLRRFASLHETVASMHLGRKGAFEVALLSLANSAIVIWIVAKMCGAAGYPVRLLAISALVPLIDVLSTLPVSFAGVGVREWGYVHGLPLLGVPADAALAISLSLSALMILRNLGGLLFLPAIPVWARSASADSPEET